MKHVNWLIKAIFYAHKDTKADSTLSIRNYKVGYLGQQHGNLCTNACENMIAHFLKKPFASMEENPRSLVGGTDVNQENYVKNKEEVMHASTTLSYIDDYIKTGPFIMNLPLRYGVGHSVVVIGHNDGGILYHDPMTGPNRFLSYQELTDLCQKYNNGNLEADCPRSHYNTKLTAHERQTKVTEPEFIYTSSKYGKHFNAEKMENPVTAIKDFLNDYAKNSFWSRRHHREAVSKFLNDNENVDLTTLVTNLVDKFSDNKTGELAKRIEAIKEFSSLSDTFKKKLHEGRDDEVSENISTKNLGS